MTLNESVKDYLDDFLENEGKGEFWTNIDWLDIQVGSFSISQNPTQNGGIYSTDLVGNEYKTSAFTYNLAFEYSEDIATMLDNGKLLESLSYYIKRNNQKRIYPKLSKGRIPTDFRIVQTPFLSQIGDNNQIGVYTVILELVYIEPKEELNV